MDKLTVISNMDDIENSVVTAKIRQYGTFITGISGAVERAFQGLDGLISRSALARIYFDRSQSWLSQKLNGSKVHDRERCFNTGDARLLSSAFRDIARRLMAMADDIDRAAM